MFERSYETGLLVEFLRNVVKEGRDGVITYGELSKECGIEIDGSSHQLRTARKTIETQERCIFLNERGKGIRIAVGDAQASVAAGALEHMKRDGRRRLRRMENVKYETMSDDAKLMHNVGASVVGAVQMMLRQKSQEKISKIVEERSNRIPVAETMQLFSNKD